MNERENDAVRTGPVVDRSSGISRASWPIVAAFALAGVAVFFALIHRKEAEPFVLALLGVLAVVGFVAILAGAIGLIRVVDRRQRPEISRDFLDSMDDGILISDTDGRIRYANSAYGNLTGATGETDLRAVDRVFGGQSSAAESIYRIAQELQDGQTGEEEVRMSPPPGGRPDEVRWYRIKARPFSTETGSLIVWSVADISEERAQQETVFQELQHAIDYLDHAPVGFFSAEPDGRIVYLNATLAEWLGLDIAQFAAGMLTLGDIVRGDNVALLTGVRGEHGHDRTDIVDLDLVKRDGQSLPVRLLHRVPVNIDGAPGATRTIVLNRSRGEETTDLSEALRAADVRFARFFNSTPIAIAAIDGGGRIGRTNAQFLTMFGEAIGEGPADRNKLVDLVAEADRPSIAAALESAKGGPGPAAIPPIDADLAGGGDRSARFYINPVADGGDGEEVVIVNAIDITDQRALEEQFAQSQKMETVGKLAGGIAHDFNNVLTAIIGFSDLLLANHRPSDPSFQDIMNIKQNANRAAGLVRQLLAFSRRQTLRPAVVQLGDLLSDITILLTRLLGENVKLELVHGRDLWPIKADLNQLEQVVINLAVNGRDAMPQGGTMTVRTGNVPAAEIGRYPYQPLPAVDYVLLEVEDTGTGMPADVQERIFEPFFSTKEVGKGTGLGLSTVYGIVKQSGAQIFLESDMGKGTTFRVFFPRHVPAEGEVEAEHPDQAKEIADLTGTANILLVEDEEAVRAFAARALQSRGYQVYEASSGVEALEVMEEAGGEIDLVVSDVVMPELDGPSLLRELRKTRPELKIIFVSGYAEDAFRKNLPDGETFRFLPKPFSLKELAVAVKETLGR